MTDMDDSLGADGAEGDLQMAANRLRLAGSPFAELVGEVEAVLGNLRVLLRARRPVPQAGAPAQDPQPAAISPDPVAGGMPDDGRCK